MYKRQAINSILDVIKLRVKAGATSHLDLAQEQAQIEAVQAQLPSLETLEKEALYSLAVLLGRPPEGFDVTHSELDAVLAPPVGAGLPSDLLLRRPDVAQAEAILASAHANVDAARAAFLPQISLNGSGGFLSSTIGTLLQVSNSGYTYGAGLLQTIFDGGKLIGGKRLAEATQTQYIAAYQSAALNAYADVESALVEVANTGRAENHLRGLISAAQEAFEIAQLQYRQGVADPVSYTHLDVYKRQAEWRPSRFPVILSSARRRGRRATGAARIGREPAHTPYRTAPG